MITRESDRFFLCLLFKLSSEALHNKLLFLAPKLRLSSTWHQLYTQHDMTPTEYEAHRKLQEEIKEAKIQVKQI